MSGPASSRGLRKATRDVLQAIAAAASGGGSILLIDAITGNFEPTIGVIVAFVMKIVFTYLQNYLETAGKIPVLLPSPGLVSAVLDPVTGATLDKTPLVAPNVGATVDALSDKTGAVAGAVTDLTGNVVGEVTGQLSPLKRIVKRVVPKKGTK